MYKRKPQGEVINMHISKLYVKFLGFYIGFSLFQFKIQKNYTTT